MRRENFRWIAAMLLACCCVLHATILLAADAPMSVAEVQTEYRANLGKFAEDLAAKGKAAEARVVRDWLPPTKNRQIFYLFDDSLPPDADFAEEFRKQRTDFAEKLFAAVTAEVKLQKSADAAVFQTLHQVLREDPDHAAARKILGHRQQGEKWSTDFNGPLDSRAATLDHPNLGWKRGAYWRIESRHFQVVTNHSAAEGKKVAADLEQVYCVWRQMFFDLVARPGALAARFEDSAEPLFREKKHRVVLFQNRDEYNAALKSRVPNIEITTGLFIDKDLQSYFYAADPSDRLALAARYHEVVHQLLQENIGGRFIPGEQANFFAVEGIATYFESLAHGPGYISLGGWEADRLQFARYRSLNGDKSWPFEKLIAVRASDWQQSSDLRQLYSRSSGLTQFLLDGENGKRRNALIDLVGLLYRKSDKQGSLTSLAGESTEQLAGRYEQFLQVTDDDLQTIIEPARLRNLSLGRTEVTDRGLLQLKFCSGLEWLDLTGLKVSDDGLQIIAGLPRLKQLFLEGTRGTPRTLALIAGLKDLEELDLTGWPLKDEDLRALSGLSKLETLYLTNTPISDAGLQSLKSLPNLKILETSGTRVTAAGRKQLEQIQANEATP